MYAPPPPQGGAILAGIPAANQVGQRPLAPPPSDKAAPQALGAGHLDQVRHVAAMQQQQQQMGSRLQNESPQRLNSPQRLRGTTIGRTNSSPRIDPQQVPGPGGVAPDQEAVKHFSTKDNKVPPPPSTSTYIVTDEGNASPRYLKLSITQVPFSKELLAQSHLPLGLVMKPLADPGPGEEPVPVVDFGEAGPLRCQRCRAYINPFVRFIEGGQRYVCSFCSIPNEVPREYYCNVDAYGVRRDASERPELCKGSVDFCANKSYVGRPVTEPVFLFVIDVSAEAVANGMLGQVALTIQASLDELALEDRTRIGFITFDSSVHFYSLRSGQSKVDVRVVSEIDDPFVPLPPSFLVRATESRPAIDLLLSRLPRLYVNTTESRSAMGAALTAAHRAIADVGGRIMVFQSALPNHGPGALQRRDNPNLYGTEKERALLVPQTSFYHTLGGQCSKSNISVDLFLFPKTYIDVASLSCLSRQTNGYVFFYAGFRSDFHGAKLHNELSGCLQAVHAYDGLLRVRVSGALSVDRYLGNISMINPTDVSLPALDYRTTVSCTFTYNERLDESKDTYFQCALLYTNARGERRIRVHNLSAATTSVLSNIYRAADLDTILTCHARASAEGLFSTAANPPPLPGLRDAFAASSIECLTAYRKLCAATSNAGQLILPETLKLMPLYALALQKAPAFRTSPDVGVDRRIFHGFLLSTLYVPDVVRLVHPRMFCLSTLTDADGLPNSLGEATLPAQVGLSAEKLDPHHAYLFEDGMTMILWLGRQVSSSFLTSLLNITSTEEIVHPNMPLPVLDSDTSKRVRFIINSLASRSQYFPLLTIVRQGDAVLEPWFATMLVEDKQGQTRSYIDTLIHYHRQIQTNLGGS
jgi:protein transport protein SEC24